MWPMACVTDPRFSEERIEFPKPLSLVYIIDDLFDVRGSIDTLTLFTDAVNRYYNMYTLIRSKEKVHTTLFTQMKENKYNI